MPRRTGHVFILRHVLLLGVRVARGVSPINTSSLALPVVPSFSSVFSESAFTCILSCPRSLSLRVVMLFWLAFLPSAVFYVLFLPSESSRTASLKPFSASRPCSNFPTAHLMEVELPSMALKSLPVWGPVCLFRLNPKHHPLFIPGSWQTRPSSNCPVFPHASASRLLLF